MNYCKHLKKRKNKPYCKLLDKEITLSECSALNATEHCKEYRFPVKGKIENSKNALSSQKTVQNSLHNSAKTLQKMKNKSKKLAKMERKRFSVFTTSDRCFVCESTHQLTWNEIYRGRNRANSMKYGFCLRICLNCHREYQDDVSFNELWHKTAQKYFEENIGTRDEFIAIFRRNYLK